jgi:metal-responsive CopG/Arc/MetJ family transcriptional regulator
MATSRGNTRTITVSFPTDLATQAEQIAKAESRTMSELFREAFRSYRAEAVRKRLDEAHAYGRLRGSEHSAEDVEHLVKETRKEIAKKLAKGPAVLRRSHR